MPSFRLLTIAVLASLVLTTAASCGKGGEPLVKVGRAQITNEDLETLARVNPRLKPRLGTPQGRQKVLENYVEQEMLYQESVNRGLNRAADLKDKIALYEKILVAQALLDTELDKKVKEYYDAHKDEFERVKVAHILIRAAMAEAAKPEEKKDEKKDAKKPTAKRSEQEALKLAESVRDRLVKGEDFGKVAKEVSEDDRTKSAMGELGYITIKDRRLERWGWLPVAEKAFAMKAGEISEPIKTQDGFHVVKVLEEKKQQPLEEAEAGIKFRLQADIRTTLLDDLKKKYKVEYLSKKDEAAPAPGAPTTPGASSAPVEPAVPAPAEPGAPAEPPAPATN
ncbi:MAG TPA: peptidylprolyl isomerase [bacterium]|nr:peptidylprolyl isomerase [bacterium]